MKNKRKAHISLLNRANDNWIILENKIKTKPSYDPELYFNGIIKDKAATINGRSGKYCLFKCKFGIFYASYVNYTRINITEFAIFKTCITDNHFYKAASLSEHDLCYYVDFRDEVYMKRNAIMDNSKIQDSILEFIKNKLDEERRLLDVQ